MYVLLYALQLGENKWALKEESNVLRQRGTEVASSLPPPHFTSLQNGPFELFTCRLQNLKDR